MGKFQRKHILPLVLLVICLALATQLFRQANQIYMMKESIQRDMEYQADYLVHACVDLSGNLDTDKEMMTHFISQLQSRLNYFHHHTYLYRQFSDVPGYDYSEAYQIMTILGKCCVVVDSYDDFAEEEQEIFLNFLAELSDQIRLAFSYSYRYESDDLDEEFAYVMAGWKQLDQYMKENNIWDYCVANIDPLDD